MEAWLFLAGGATPFWHPPHEDLKCATGNCFIENMGKMADTTIFIIEYDAKVQNWKYPNNLAVRKR